MKLFLRFKTPIFFLVVCIIAVYGCKKKVAETNNPIGSYIDSVKQNYAPDKRVALFAVETSLIKDSDSYVLRGESNLPEAVNVLKMKLNKANITYTDSIVMLPTSTFATSNWAIVKISVANLRSKPGHSSELSTQATLGTPVKLYKKIEDWYLIQTPDNYLAWVDGGGIEILKNDDFDGWKSAKKVVYTEVSGYSYESPISTQVVSDLVAGSILELVADSGFFFEVKYPDGRKAFVLKSESQNYDDWLVALEQTSASLVATSKQLMGLPYLWGGTSTKGVDCSGFTKTIYFLNGMVLPRDASQQIHTGKVIDVNKDFSDVAVGDLLFFGKKATDSTKQRVIHVGMWIGNNEFIHSAGRVHISSFDKESPNFDAYNYDRYLQTNRVLNEENKEVINLQEMPVFKD